MAPQHKSFAPPDKLLQSLVLLIFTLSAAVTLAGIFSSQGGGTFLYESIRGEKINIYGKGIYQHMSAEVAIQGIAQDYFTLCLALPLLLLANYHSHKGSEKWRFILSGTLAYIFVTYFFYTAMAMYNQFFLAYAALVGTSFFALAMVLLRFDLGSLRMKFEGKPGLHFSGGFLIFNAILIALLWLSVVLPPLLDGTVYPPSLEHYTTLVVQGFDLGLFLPLSFVSGFLLVRRQSLGFLLTPVYLVFLSLQMGALLAKIIYMGVAGYPVFPVILFIPILAAVSVTCSCLILRGVS
ncbi:MAG: hypothetical protein ACO1O1_05745 [Adhaeribacter sp.]